MTRYKFHTAPRHRRQYRDQLLRMPKGRLRGAIRGQRGESADSCREVSRFVFGVDAAEWLKSMSSGLALTTSQRRSPQFVFRA